MMKVCICSLYIKIPIVQHNTHPSLLQYLGDPQIYAEVVVLVKSQTKVSIRRDVLNRGIYKLQVEVLNHGRDGEVHLCVCEAKVR